MGPEARRAAERLEGRALDFACGVCEFLWFVWFLWGLFFFGGGFGCCFSWCFVGVFLRIFKEGF